MLSRFHVNVNNLSHLDCEHGRWAMDFKWTKFIAVIFLTSEISLFLSQAKVFAFFISHSSMKLAKYCQLVFFSKFSLSWKPIKWRELDNAIDTMPAGIMEHVLCWDRELSASPKLLISVPGRERLTLLMPLHKLNPHGFTAPTKRSLTHDSFPHSSLFVYSSALSPQPCKFPLFNYLSNYFRKCTWFHRPSWWRLFEAGFCRK